MKWYVLLFPFSLHDLLLTSVFPFTDLGEAFQREQVQDKYVAPGQGQDIHKASIGHVVWL